MVGNSEQLKAFQNITNEMGKSTKGKKNNFRKRLILNTSKNSNHHDKKLK